MTITAFSPTQSSPGGGVQATITGTGFPVGPTDDLSVKVCDNQATQFTTVSNQQIVFTIPLQVNSCSGSNNQISYRGQTATFTFAYNPSIAPQITSLSKSSSSPILKSSISIIGSNFNSGRTNVYLMQNGVQKY
jgi:hypothetical protein